MRFILLILFPFIVFSGEIDFDNLELGDVDLPSFEEIEIKKGPKIEGQYPSTINHLSDGPGGIHETFAPPKYSAEKDIEDSQINWDEDIYPSKNEKYYLYFGLGPASLKYSGSGEDYRSMGSGGFTLSLDLFGAYWPKYNQKFMYGVLVNLLLDQFTIDDYSVTQLQLTSAISLYYFLGPNIGSGFYFRGDLGIGLIPLLTTNENSNVTSNWLWGGNWLLGAGYAFPFWEETRIILGLSMSNSYTSFSDYKEGNESYVLSLGGLF